LLGFLFPDPLFRRVVGQVPGSRKLKDSLSDVSRAKWRKRIIARGNPHGVAGLMSQSAPSPACGEWSRRSNPRAVAESIEIQKNTREVILTKKPAARFFIFRNRRRYQPRLLVGVALMKREAKTQDPHKTRTRLLQGSTGGPITSARSLRACFPKAECLLGIYSGRQGGGRSRIRHQARTISLS
jgi:hypothetical protein